MSVSYFLYLIRPYSLDVGMFRLSFLHFAWVAFLGYGNIWFTFLVPCRAILLERWQCLLYFPTLCNNIMHDVCISIYVLFCGWSCTLYDGLSRLRERPSSVMSTLDLVVWVWTQGNCCRCIFMLYCVCEHCGVIVSIYVTWVTLVSLCMWHASICLMLWGAPACLSMSMLACIVCKGLKPCRCAIAHQMQNSVRFLSWKWSTFVVVFLQLKPGENSVWCAMMHLRRSAIGFPPRK